MAAWKVYQVMAADLALLMVLEGAVEKVVEMVVVKDVVWVVYLDTIMVGKSEMMKVALLDNWLVVL